VKANGFLPYFNASQRRGIILLFALILVLQMCLIFDDFSYANQKFDIQVSETLQQQYDSLKNIALQKKQKKIYSFNPNYLTDYRGYFLGLTTGQIDRIFAYRKQGKYIKNKQEFKQISGINDSMYKVLKPYINIPVYKNNYTSEAFKNTGYKLTTTDINKATAEDLQTVSGIGPVLSKRIVKYRSSIGGFTDKTQLNKVYGLEPEVVQRVWQKFKLTSLPEKSVIPADKKSLNQATAQELQQINGIGEVLSHRIVNYRESLGGFSIPEQLNEVYGLSPETRNNIWKYYKIENPNKNFLKINLNDANIRELAKNPYISYQLAKKIVSYRTLHGAFHTFDDLLNVKEFPKDKLKVISLYLKLD